MYFIEFSRKVRFIFAKDVSFFFLASCTHVSTLATSGKRRVLFLFMNNAFVIGIADSKLVYIITIDAGAVIIARNAPRKILRIEVVRSDVPADLRRSKRERKYKTCCLQERKDSNLHEALTLNAGCC